MEQRDRILEHLDEVLQCASFRSSQRSQEFLRHVVLSTLDGESHRLKERVIGTELFGRAADYDTGEDAVVRVKANEVRKRLAQFYVGAGPEQKIRIVLPTGSYVPEFLISNPERSRLETAAVVPVAGEIAREQPDPVARARWHIAALTIGFALSVAAVAGVHYWNSRSDVLEEFWEPAIRSSRPVMIGIGGNSNLYVYKGIGGDGRPFDPPDEADLRGADLVSVRGQFVGAGGAQAVFRLATFFARAGKDASLRTGPALSFQDMKDHPSVVIGAYSSPLTWAAARTFRFYFDDPQNGHRIRDREEPGLSWATERNARNEIQSDYALISRVLHAETGEFLVVASGLAGEGCIAAADFVTRPQALAAALRHAPADWKQMNFQAILRTRVVGNATAAPVLVRQHFWRP